MLLRFLKQASPLFTFSFFFHALTGEKKYPMFVGADANPAEIKQLLKEKGIKTFDWYESFDRYSFSVNASEKNKAYWQLRNNGCDMSFMRTTE